MSEQRGGWSASSQLQANYKQAAGERGEREREMGRGGYAKARGKILWRPGHQFATFAAVCMNFTASFGFFLA